MLNLVLKISGKYLHCGILDISVMMKLFKEVFIKHCNFFILNVNNRDTEVKNTTLRAKAMCLSKTCLFVFNFINSYILMCGDYLHTRSQDLQEKKFTSDDSVIEHQKYVFFPRNFMMS